MARCARPADDGDHIPGPVAQGDTELASGVSGLLLPAFAQGLAPTASMRGGSNNYRRGAPIVSRILRVWAKRATWR
jgi:hypothetical protein